MRQKAMTKHYEHETPDSNQVKNQRPHNLHNLRGACDLAPSLRVGLQAYPNMRRRKASHQVTLPQIPLEYLWKFQVLWTCSAHLGQQI